jgi:putative addiction module killer protein
LRGYIDEKGNKPFASWLEALDPTAAAKVTIVLARMEQGNFSKTKGVGAGVYEYKIDFGPGYRIYFGRDDDRLVILIGGGTKNDSKMTSSRRRRAGLTTSDERNRRVNDAPDPRLQRNHPDAGSARSGFPPSSSA